MTKEQAYKEAFEMKLRIEDRRKKEKWYKAVAIAVAVAICGITVAVAK